MFPRFHVFIFKNVLKIKLQAQYRYHYHCKFTERL